MRGLTVRDLAEQRHARAALGRALQRTDRFVARTQKRDRARLGFSEIVEQVAEDSLGRVGRRHDHQNLCRPSARCIAASECRPRRRDRFVKRVSRAGSRRSNAIEQRRERAAGRFQALEERSRRPGVAVRVAVTVMGR